VHIGIVAFALLIILFIAAVSRGTIEPLACRGPLDNSGFEPLLITLAITTAINQHHSRMMELDM